jgi:hypothetical protein
MMLKIAHRGNTNGPSSKENSPEYIQSAIDQGYNAEIDIWLINEKLFLGHDFGQYEITEDFLYHNAHSLWIHCKNFEALDYFSKLGNYFNYFWHETDDHTITSHMFLWTYPEKQVGQWSVIVDLEGKGKHDCYAICTDYVNHPEE